MDSKPNRNPLSERVKKTDASGFGEAGNPRNVKDYVAWANRTMGREAYKVGNILVAEQPKLAVVNV